MAYGTRFVVLISYYRPSAIGSSGCIQRDTHRIGFDTAVEPRRMLKTRSLLGRNERKPETYVVPVR